MQIILPKKQIWPDQGAEQSSCLVFKYTEPYVYVVSQDSKDHIFSIDHSQIVGSKVRSMLFPSNRLSGTKPCVPVISAL